MMQLSTSNRANLNLTILLLAAVIVGGLAPHPAPLAPLAGIQAHFQTAAIPSGNKGQQIRLGKLIFDQTPKYASAYVGNRLSCSDCHIRSGTASHAAPMIDIANIFPSYNKRAGRVISLQERFQECFTRSENGSPLPLGSEEMNALTAYVGWLSRDGVKGQAYQGRGFVKLPALTGDPGKGKAIYASECSSCHRTDGAGAPPVLPPLWGPNSYSDGAGMDDPKKMAAFLIHNMPQNHPGTLTPQDAFDVAAFVHTMPRPKFNQAYKSY
jgi:thiosulfate dehydrogenase